MTRLDERPKRIQRKRTRGWKMPPNCVSVTRPGKWGNSFSVEEYGVRLAIFNHRQRIRNLALVAPHVFDELRGKDLACWCHLCDKHKDGKPLGVECADCEPCHADTLLEVANQDERPKQDEMQDRAEEREAPTDDGAEGEAET